MPRQNAVEAGFKIVFHALPHAVGAAVGAFGTAVTVSKLADGEVDGETAFFATAAAAGTTFSTVGLWHPALRNAPAPIRAVALFISFIVWWVVAELCLGRAASDKKLRNETYSENWRLKNLLQKTQGTVVELNRRLAASSSNGAQAPVTAPAPVASPA